MAIKIAVSVVLLTIVLSRVDLDELWSHAKSVSLFWIFAAFVVYSVTMFAGTWRWHLLLEAQDVDVSPRWLFGSFLVANFFNNFLPSNIGGDVIRISDTARRARSTTLATMIVLVDRVLGLLGLVLVAAIGATWEGNASHGGPMAIWPSWLWAGFLLAAAIAAPAVFAPSGVGRLLQPLTVVHPEWVGDRIQTLITALGRFRERLGSLAACFAGAVVVQALMIVYYLTVVYALHIRITPWHLAVIVPITLVVQMLPISVNGFGIREATFSFYFTRLGLPIQSAVLMSLGGAVLMILFSLGGAVVYVARHR